MSADAPSLGGYWLAFQEECVPPTWTVEEVNRMKLAFLAGCAQILAVEFQLRSAGPAAGRHMDQRRAFDDLREEGRRAVAVLAQSLREPGVPP